MVDSNIPRWLQERVAFNAPQTSSVSQDIQQGANLYQQGQENKIRAGIAERQRQESMLRMEALRLKMEGETFVKAGAIELGRLMEQGGQKGIYHTDAFEGQLWALGQRFPQLIDSDTFKWAAKVVENAKLAKDKSALTALREENLNLRTLANIVGRSNLEDKKQNHRLEALGVKWDNVSEQDARKHEYRLEELDIKNTHDLEKQRIKLENDLTLLGERGVQNEHLKRIQHELDKVRDAARPRSSGSWRYDLPESKRMPMQSKLRALEAWREIYSGTKYDAEFDRRFEAIEKEFAPFVRKETPSGEPAKADKELPVMEYDPDTRTFKPTRVE
jgi:hypothetical protein